MTWKLRPNWVMNSWQATEPEPPQKSPAASTSRVDDVPLLPTALLTADACCPRWPRGFLGDGRLGDRRHDLGFDAVARRTEAGSALTAIGDRRHAGDAGSHPPGGRAGGPALRRQRDGRARRRDSGSGLFGAQAIVTVLISFSNVPAIWRNVRRCALKCVRHGS